MSRGALPGATLLLVGTRAGTGLQYRPLTKRIVLTGVVLLFTVEGRAGNAGFTHAYMKMTLVMLHMHMRVATTTNPWSMTQLQKMNMMTRPTRGPKREVKQALLQFKSQIQKMSS